MSVVDKRVEILRTTFNGFTKLLDAVTLYNGVTLKPETARQLNALARELAAMINEMEAEAKAKEVTNDE